MNENNEAFRLYQKFRNVFERVFVISENGTLRANQATLREVLKFYDEFKIVIHSCTELRLETPVFEQSGRGKISQVNENKKKLIQYYVVCFSAYAKVCKALNVEINRSYNHPSCGNRKTVFRRRSRKNNFKINK